MRSAASTVTRAEWQLDRRCGMLQETVAESNLTDSSTAVSCISERELLDFMIEARRRPSPPAEDLFPWLYGISPMNSLGATFLRYRHPIRNQHDLFAPPMESAGILFVKFADPDDSYPSIKGSIAVEQILAKARNTSRLLGRFRDTDAVDGLPLRNFAIQPVKFAQICDIVLYSPHPHTSEKEKARLIKKGLALAKLIDKAQTRRGLGRRTFFFPGDLIMTMKQLGRPLIASTIAEPEELVDVWDLGTLNDYRVMNWENGLSLCEHNGVVSMASASEILPRVMMGNFISTIRRRLADLVYEGSEDPKLPAAPPWKTKVLCDFEATPPSISYLDSLIRQSRKRSGFDEALNLTVPSICDFAPHSGYLDSRAVAAIISLCKLLFIRSEQDESVITSTDGYRYCSPYVALFVMYSTGKSLSEALLYLHDECKRPLSFSKAEWSLTIDLEAIVYEFSPIRHSSRTRQLGAVPVSAVWKFLESEANQIGYLPSALWLEGFPGAFPSRILDHLYLGSCEHANSPGMLRALGIRRILSVGETLDWLKYPIEAEEVEQMGFVEVRHLANIQDDGVDSVLPHLPSCLEFLADAEQQNQKTLVHCRKGVSRSAAVCIAEVMRAKHWGLPRAYVHVRVHRLDVVIQPNMRLMYDLLKFEEQAPFLDGRTVDWPVLSREITRLNDDYEL